jgi:hypothetical protein
MPTSCSASAELKLIFRLPRQMRRRFERSHSPNIAEESIIEMALAEVEVNWAAPLRLVPGKEALAAVNEHLQQCFGVNVTPTAIVEAMRLEEVPAAARELMQRLAQFAAS